VLDKKNNFILQVQKKINKISLSNTNLKIYYKKKNNKKQVFTNLDVKIEKFLRKEIKNKFPNDNIIGEELKNKPNLSKFTWYIDPVDGTKNLIINIPTWSNMIGLFYEEKAINSLINFPEMNKFYYSIKSKSFINKKNKVKKIKSSKIRLVKDAKIVFNSLHVLKSKKVLNFVKRFKNFTRVTGIDAYNFCLIAEGKIDVLIEKGLKIVDIMPIIALIENSGGIITDWQGNRNFKKGEILVAGNKYLHKKVLSLLKS